MNKSKWTGERLETFVKNETTIEHLHRYGLTLNFIEDCTVLDLACGNGYGSNLMAQYAKEVIGVDIDESVISYAKKTYISSNLQFEIGSAEKTNLESRYFDIVVSFETIEHHDRHEEMLEEIKRVLKPGGILIISSPDKYYYSDVRSFKNKYHIKELYEDEFKGLMKKHFINCIFYKQKSSYFSIIAQENSNNLPNRLLSGDFSTMKENYDWKPLYWIGVCSDMEIPDNKIIPLFDGSVLYESIQRNIHQLYRSSYSYKLGHFMLSPFRFFNMLFSKIRNSIKKSEN